MPAMRRLLALLLALAAGSAAQAADLTVLVRTPQGKPIANAVVSAYPATGAERSRLRTAGALRVTQHDMSFDPFVLVAPVGAEVSFPNLDTVRHHVYSFSPAKTFELKLYGHDETRTVRFDKPGVVALGCNIHDQMSAFIVVVDTPFAAKTDAAGQVVLHDLPPAALRLQVWHPYAKLKQNTLTRALAAPAAGQRETVVLDLRPAPRRAAY